MKRYYIVKKGNRASIEGVRDGQIVYSGNDMYGCARDDSRITGVEHDAYSHNERGEPFFTMPKCDVQTPPIYGAAGLPNFELDKDGRDDWHWLD